MKISKTKKMVLAALMLALAIVLPFLTMQLQALGNKILPMHLPVLLAGFFCGPWYGLLVGLIAPLLRSVLFSMPPMFPVAIAMAVELAAYGFFCGFFREKFPKTKPYIYVSLILAMLAGRILWGLVSALLYAAGGSSFTFAIFWAGAFANAIPGILIQLVVVPLLVMLGEKQLNR